MYAMDFLKIIEREHKPRKVGLTLCHDPGFGPTQLEGHLEAVGDFVDYIKFRNLTPRLWSESLFKRKTEIIRRANIKCLPGGMYGELAYLQGQWDRAAEYLNEVGCNAFELSENYVTFSPEEKERMIKRLAAANVDVLYEWGRKTPSRPLDPEHVAGEFQRVLDLGVGKVILEENEVNAILGPDGGGPEASRLDRLFERVGMEPLIVEATRPAQQYWLLKNYGTTINLGANLRLEDIPLLEAHRRGLGLKVDWFAVDPWLEKAGIPKHID